MKRESRFRSLSLSREMFIGKGRGRNLHVIGSIRVGIGSFGEIKPFVREGFLVLLISCAKARIRCQATVRRVLPSCPHRRGFSWFTHLGEVTSLREKDMEEIWRAKGIEGDCTFLPLRRKKKKNKYETKLKEETSRRKEKYIYIYISFPIPIL